VSKPGIFTARQHSKLCKCSISYHWHVSVSACLLRAGIMSKVPKLGSWGFTSRWLWDSCTLGLCCGLSAGCLHNCRHPPHR